MKAVQTKTQTNTQAATQSARQAGKTRPFFKKGPGQGFFKPANPNVQTKLNVGEPGDVYEKEADHAADRVVKGMQASAQTGLRSGGIHRKPIFESENDPAEHRKVQKKASGPGSAASKASDSGASKASARGSSKASPAVESGIARSKGSGSSLPATTRNQMESSFGADFSGVRVHQDSGAQEMNKDLSAQAFTHGKDIYFDKGKFNPASNDGRHLLAHELTHVVQQTGNGDGKTISRKINGTPATGGAAATAAGTGPGPHAGASTSASTHPGAASCATAGLTTAPASIQRAGGANAGKLDLNDPDDVKDALKKMKKSAGGEGLVEFNEKESGNKRFQIILTNFPLKKYVGAPYLEPDKDVEKPRYERKTEQDKRWKDIVGQKVSDLIDKWPLPKVEKAFLLTVLGGSHAKGKSQLYGDLEALKDTVRVPFWTKEGQLMIHQIEHIVDWQIMGKDADTKPDNLILLDKDTNLSQGQDVKDKINKAVANVVAQYANTGLPIGKLDYKRAISRHVVKFRSFKAKPVTPKSVILAEDILNQKNINEGILSKKTIEIRDSKIPDGYCLIRTAVDGVAYLVPYDFNGPVIQIKGDAKKDQLKSITQIKVAKSGKNLKGAEKKIKLSFTREKSKGEDTPRIYRMTRTGHATVLQEGLKLVGMSPIEITEDSIDVHPMTGLKAEGKVKPDVSLLKDVDINFSLEAGEFSVTAEITSDKLKGKLPGPISIDSCQLGITVSSAAPLSVSGGIDFSIKNLGSGSLIGTATPGSFGLEGDFEFSNTKAFDTAKLAFSYLRKKEEGDGAWAASGDLVFKPNAVKGIKAGSIHIGYKDGTVSGSGHFDTAIPKMDRVNVAVQFDKNGNFTISGDTSLKNVPGIKDNHISVTLTKEQDDYSVSAEGAATPNLPNIPGLGATLMVSYNKGVFTLQGTATYQKDKLDGSLTVGVTNAVVDENGAPSKDAEDGKLKIFGNGSITLHLLKGVDATLQGAVDDNGEMYIWGVMDVRATPFDPVDIDKKIFEVSTSIPLVGIPFASVNLDLSSSASFHFHWDPLTIHLQATLDRTNIKEIGKAGGELTASLSSQAEAGFMFKIGAGVSLSIAIIKLGAHINGAVDLGLKAEVGAEAKAKWDMQKGLQLEEAEAHLSGVPTVAFILSGDITADVDLWLTSYNVYKKEMTFAKKQLDLSQFAFGVSIPLKIDENGKIQGIDYSKLKLQPELGKDAGDSISDQVLNGDDKKKKEQKEREARDKIRNKVVEKLRAKQADGETNLRSYASDLRDEIMDDTPDELQGMVDQVIEEELSKMEEEQAAKAAAAEAAAAAAQNPPNTGAAAPATPTAPMTI